jgi:small neutral amino acid transporter SnatA (MarC family)
METTLRSEQAQPLFDKAIERFKEVSWAAAAAAGCCWLLLLLAAGCMRVCLQQGVSVTVDCTLHCH